MGRLWRGQRLGVDGVSKRGFSGIDSLGLLDVAFEPESREALAVNFIKGLDKDGTVGVTELRVVKHGFILGDGVVPFVEVLLVSGFIEGRGVLESIARDNNLWVHGGDVEESASLHVTTFAESVETDGAEDEAFGTGVVEDLDAHWQETAGKLGVFVAESEPGVERPIDAFEEGEFCGDEAAPPFPDIVKLPIGHGGIPEILASRAGDIVHQRRDFEVGMPVEMTEDGNVPVGVFAVTSQMLGNEFG